MISNQGYNITWKALPIIAHSDQEQQGIFSGRGEVIEIIDPDSLQRVTRGADAVETSMQYLWGCGSRGCIPGGGGGGGGGGGVGGGGGGGGGGGYRGGPHLRYVFRGRRGLFFKSPHVRDFVKEGYFFVPRYEVWGSNNHYNPLNIRGSDAE